jgi:PBP1b-binding outer membrane lipoprotein LpoB
MEAFMKYTTILLIAVLVGGCSSYSERGTGAELEDAARMLPDTASN